MSNGHDPMLFRAWPRSHPGSPGGEPGLAVLPVLVTDQGKAERGKSKSLETYALIIANPKLDYGEQLIHSSTARYFRPSLSSQTDSCWQSRPMSGRNRELQFLQRGLHFQPRRWTPMGWLLCHVTWGGSIGIGRAVRGSEKWSWRRSDASCVLHNFGPPKGSFHEHLCVYDWLLLCCFCVSYPTIPFNSCRSFPFLYFSSSLLFCISHAFI